MSDIRTDLPSVKSANFDQRIREVLMTYLGRQGNPLDRGLTLRDLVDSGIVAIKDGYSLRPGASTVPLEPGTGVEPTYEADLTPPPQPSGFAVNAAIGSVFIEHDDPFYYQGHGHLRTRVYGVTYTSGPLPTFDDAVEISQFTGTVHAYATNPATTWHLWIKWETRDGVLSPTPAGGTNGLVVTTGQDVSALLEALTGEITESQLYESLGSRIDLIDGGTGLPGSVNARLLDEATTRAAAITAESIARADAIAAEAAARTQAIADEATARTAAIADEASARTAAIAAEAALRATAVSDEATARAAADAAEAQARVDAIAQEVTDRNAAIAVETQARIDAVAALTGDIQDANTAIAAETQARIDAVQAEADARLEAFSIEARTRAQQVQANAEAVLRNAVAIDTERIGRGEAVSLARFEIETKVDAGLLAEATARLQLQSEVASNTAAITSEQLTRASADTALASDITALTAQTNANAAAIASETTARTDADTALSSQITTLSATVSGNAAAIQTESTARASADAAMAEQVYTVAAGVASNLAAIQTETAARVDADNALSTTITTLTATVDANTAAITSEQTARANADTALASDISTLTADVSDAFAAIDAEETARADAVSAEASARTTLASQLRGSYTGSDLSALSSGLLYQERIARVSEDQSLAQQITLLSAGAGEQFDWQSIWYFDSGVESWSGNGTPSVSQGWLRPADQASDAYVNSATGIGADGNKYSQVRLRIRKTGTPTFAGYLWWRASADSTWDTARRVSLTEPTYDANGIGLITVNPAWTVTIDRIRVDLSSAQTSTNYFEIDWVAIGRPSPGASSAQLLEEQTARAAADSAEVTAREALAVKLVGTSNPTGLTLGTLTSGLVYDERTARTTETGVLTTNLSSLQATVTSNNTTLSAAITAEETARINADSALTTSVNSLTATVNSNTAAITAEQTARADADTALTSSLNSLSSRVDSAEAGITSEATTRASADSAEVSARETLSTALVGQADPTGLTLGTLASGLIYDERTARVTAVDSVVSTVTSLQTTVTNNYNTLDSAITSEATARSTADTAEADARESLSTVLTGVTDPTSLTLGTLAAGLIFDEKESRVSADSALSTSISGLSSSVGTLSSDLTTLQQTVADNESASAAQITTLVSSDRRLAQDLDINAEAVLRDALAINSERSAREGTVALARQELTTEMVAGFSAEAAARLLLAAQVDTNAAAIVSEQVARATADEAISTSITVLTATVDSNTAAITAEATARADADSALSSTITTLTATVDSNTAAITTESTARADADAAISSTVSALTATVNSNTAGIVAEQTARASADDALSSSITALTATVNSNTAAITSEATARADADSSLTSQINTVSATTNTKNRTYYQASQPTDALITGDLWFDTDDGNRAYRWNGAMWVDTADTRIAGNAAAITSEQTARTNADSALASDITTLTASINSVDTDLTAAIQNETTARTNADGALASDIAIVAADLASAETTLNAAITSETSARTTADSALATDITNLTSTVTGNYNTLNSAITSEASTRATQDTALASDITALTSTVNGNYSTLNAAITSEATTRTNADSALASDISALTSTVTGNYNTLNAAITSEASTRVNADNALSSQITSLTSTVDGNYTALNASISSEASTRATQDSALATQINTLRSTVDFDAAVSWQFDSSIEAWLSSGATLSVSNGALVVTPTTSDPFIRIPGLSLNGAIYNRLRMRVKRVSGTSWQGQAYYVTAGHGESESYTKTIPDTTVIGQWVVLEWDMSALTFGGNDWITNTILEVRFDLGQATSVFEIDWIAFGRSGAGGYSAVQTEATTRASETGDLFAKYTVKVDVNGYVSGFGLASTANNATPTSEFAVRADKFYVASPSGPGITPIVPFVVNTTSQVVNGVSVPAGVYMDAAYIKNGTITNAKIGDLAVDTAKIATAAISNAKIADAAITTAKINDAAITTAKINDAAITTAKIGDAAITSAKIALATITNANIADATINSAKIDAIDAGKITTGYLNAARINASTITAEKIISNSATRFDMTTLSCPDWVWAEMDFYMDHYGVALAFSGGAWNYAAASGGWYVYLGLASTTSTEYASGTWPSGAAPNPPTLMTAKFLNAGWHKAYLKMAVSGATAAHTGYITVLRSYR